MRVAITTAVYTLRLLFRFEYFVLISRKCRCNLFFFVTLRFYPSICVSTHCVFFFLLFRLFKCFSKWLHQKAQIYTRSMPFVHVYLWRSININLCAISRFYMYFGFNGTFHRTVFFLSSSTQFG